MTAIGIMVGAEISGGIAKRIPTLGIVGELFKRTEWHGLNLSIDIGKLDRRRIRQVYNDKGESEFNAEEALPLVGNQWWKLVTSPMDQSLKIPPWWVAPNMLVVSRTVAANMDN